MTGEESRPAWRRVGNVTATKTLRHSREDPPLLVSADALCCALFTSSPIQLLAVDSMGPTYFFPRNE